jgi:hypothetical protein
VEARFSLLYKNSALFRGVKWERGDVIIRVLNKTTFSFNKKKRC